MLFIGHISALLSENENGSDIESHPGRSSSREMNQVFDANLLPPTEGKALMVRHLKNYFTGNSDSESESSRPASGRKPGMTEEIYNRLIALKQRLEDDDEIKVSERTMKVLQDRQNRRESMRSLSSKSSDNVDSPDPVDPPKSQVSQGGIQLSSPLLPISKRISDFKKITTPRSPKLVDVRKKCTDSKIKSNSSTNGTKETNKLDTKCVGGRIFLTNKPKFDNRRTTDAQPTNGSHKPSVNGNLLKSTNGSHKPSVLSNLLKPTKNNDDELIDEIVENSTPTQTELATSGVKTSELIISFGGNLGKANVGKKESFQKREPDAERTTKPSFLQKLRNYQFQEEQNLEIDLVVNGIPKPRLTWYKDSKEMKLNEYRQRWAGNKVTIILFPEFWTNEALLSVTAVNQAGTAQNECILYVDSKPYEVIHEIQDIDSEAEIDSSDISEMVKELRMEQINDCDGESEYSEDFMPRDLSPIFEVTEDEITHSLRSDDSRRSSIRSIESIRSTLTMLTPTQVTRTPTIEKLSVSVSSEELGRSSNGHSETDGDKTPTPEDPLVKAESNYRTIAKLRTVEVSVINEADAAKLMIQKFTDSNVKNEIHHSARRESLQSISTIVAADDDDALSVDSYATIEDSFDNIDGSYRSTKDLMSFVTKNYLSKTCYTTATDTEATDTEVEIRTPIRRSETVASPNNSNLFPSPTSTMFPANASSNASPNDLVQEKARHEDLLVKQLEVRKQFRDRKKGTYEPSTETESEIETYNQVHHQQRRQKKMTEEERQKKERQKTFQQKYRLTQRFIEDSIKGNATSLELNQKEFDRLHRYSPAELSNRVFSDSEVFLDTDDDGMDTVSEITIDFGRTNREEFEINNSQLPLNFGTLPLVTHHTIQQEFNTICNDNYIDL